jgi:hypothetical protein
MGEFDGLRVVGDPVQEEGKFVPHDQPKKSTDEFAGMAEVKPATSANTNVNVVKSLNLNADAEATAYKNSKKSGHSINVTREQPDAFHNDFDGWEKSSPETKNYLSKSVNNVAVSRGDFQNLGFLDRVIKGVPQAYEAGRINNEIADLRWRQIRGEDTPELTAAIERLKVQQQPRIEGQSFLERGLFGASEQANLLLRTFGAGAKGGILGAGGGAGTALLLGQLGPQVALPEEFLSVPTLALKGYKIGSRMGSAVEIMQIEAGGAYDEFLQIRDVNGLPLDKDIIRTASLAVGMVNAGLELVGFGALLKTLPGGDKILGKITTAEIKNLLKRSTVRKSLKELAKRFVKGVTTETITEMAQEAVNIFAAELAKDVQEARGGVLFRPFTKKKAKERILEVGKRTVESSTILFGAPSVANVTNTIVRGEQSQLWIDKQTEVNAAVNNTLTKQKSADHIEAILNEHGQGIDAAITDDGVKRLFQSNPDKAREILIKAGIDPDRALKDAELGLDTTLTLSKIQAQLSPEEFALIKSDLKETEVSFSENQLKNGAMIQELDKQNDLFNKWLKDEEAVIAEVSRLTEEIQATGIDEEQAMTVPLIWRDIANRLSLNSTKSRAEILQELSVRRMPFERFKKLVAKGKELFQSAFHGTPFKFDKFSLEHLGKGEGAQAFGWGLYFAEKKDIADWYRKNLTDRIVDDISYKGNDIFKLKNDDLRNALLSVIRRPLDTDIETAKKAALYTLGKEERRLKGILEIEEAEGIFNIEEGLRDIKEAKEAISKLKESDVIIKKPGAVLKVELPGDDQIFEWEKTLGEQSQIVKDKLKKGIKEIKNLEGFLDEEFFNSFKGKDFYFELSSVVGSVKAASQWLSDHGIKGHKFWDGSSRNRAGDKTFNFVIYDDEVIEIVESFFQAEEGAPPKGVIDIFDDNRKLITLFETADVSTLLHETAHFALNEYLSLERAGTATESLKSDMQTVRQWLGAEEGQELTRDQSEQFAKGFELWLLEGKAPTPELNSAFARFQRWLSSVYGTVKNAAKVLGVKLNKDIKGVFDRMLSANLEVEVMAEQGGFTIKTDAEMDAYGVIKEDRIIMLNLIKESRDKATELLLEDRNKNLKNKRAQWAKEAEKEIRETDSSRGVFGVYDIVDDIHQNNLQFNRNQYNDLAGSPNAYKFLPAKNLTTTRDDAVRVEEAAMSYGFEDTQDFVDAMATTPPLDIAIENSVNQKQALHDAQFKVENYLADLKSYRDYLDIVTRYIGNKLKDAPLTAGEKKLTTRAILKRAAKQTINTMSVREARKVSKYLSAMKKAAEDERRAVLRKDWGEAARANEKVRFNYELASESVKIRNEVDKTIRRSKDAARSKTIDFEHIEAIKHLVTRYNIAPILPSEPETIPNYEKLFAGKDNRVDDSAPVDSNDGFDVPAFMRINRPIDYLDLSIEQLRDLNNAIQYLAGQGRKDKDTFLSDGETRLIEDVIDPSVEVMDKIKPLKKWEKGNMMRRLSDISRRFFARLDSLTFQAKSLDGYVNLGKAGIKGIVEQFVIDPIKKATNDKLIRKAEIQDMLEPHMKQIRKTIHKWGRSHITIPNVALPQALINDGQTKGWRAQQIFAVALNTGNESNLARLQAGYPDLNIQGVKDFLSKEDWVAIQGIWDTIDTLYNDTNTVHKRIKNYGLTKIDRVPVRTRHGVFKGGYYPAKYDPNLDFGVADRGEVSDFFAKEEANFVTPFAKSGHTQKRVNGVALPMLLDLSVVSSHIDDALQYIYFAEVIRDADRITRNGGFRDSAVRVIGKDSYNSIRPSLKHIANPRRAGLDLPGGRAVEAIRGASTAYILAWNTGVALKQPLSTFGAIRDMGLKAYVNGFFSTIMSPSTHYQRMLDLSSYMTDRLKNFDRELRSEFNKLTGAQRALYFGDKSLSWQDIVNFGYWQIRVADTMTVMPIWNGAFEDRLNADQSNLQEAINYADDIVRNSQPSAQALDLSSWQRDGGVIRLLSQFQTFTVGKYGQRQRLNYRAWKNGSITTAQYAWFNFMDALMPLVAINMLQALIWGRDLDDDETKRDILINIFSNWVLMGVPIANSLINSINFGEPIQSPVIRTANQTIMGVVNGIKGLGGFKSKKERDAALWGVMNAISIIGKVPVSKVVQRAQKGAKQKKGAEVIKYLVPAPKGKQ